MFYIGGMPQQRPGWLIRNSIDFCRSLFCTRKVKKEMSRNLPYGYDAPEPEEEEHSHELSYVVAEIPAHIECETLAAASTVTADTDIRTPELWLGSMVMKE
jgi:hypothetical protein